MSCKCPRCESLLLVNSHGRVSFLQQAYNMGLHQQAAGQRYQVPQPSNVLPQHTAAWGAA